MGSISFLFLVGVALKSTLVLSVIWLAAGWLKERSAAIRHLIWSVGFAALLVLPFFAVAIPAWRLPIIDSRLAPGLVFQARGQVHAEEAARYTGARAGVESPVQSHPRLPGWPMLLAMIWAAGSAISWAQMLTGCLMIERLRCRANPCRMPGAAELAKLLGMRDEVDLREAARGTMPITYGLFRPTIFLPADVVEWNAERRRAVLLHELAHVCRRDGATHLLARAVLGLYWWNPLAWVGWRELLKERERAADDLVLAAGTCASEYASHLLEIARAMQSPAAVGWASVAMARPSQLEGRLLAMLDTKRDRKAPRRAVTAAVSVMALCLVAPIAAVQAKSDPSEVMTAQQAGGSPATGWLKEGDVALEHAQYPQAKAAYTMALNAGGSGAEAATALIHLGMIEVAMKDFGGALSDFERAEAANSGKAGEARMWMAITQERQANLDAADGLYQSALAAEEPNSSLAATIMERYAQLLQQQGRHDEANTMRVQAAGIRKTQAELELASSEPPTPDVYRVGGGVTAPMLVSKAEPAYTQQARIAKYQGTALLSVEIGEDGVARNIKVARGLGFGLDQKAVEAVKQWRFKPGVKGGEPVKVAAQIEINFALI